MQRFLMKPAESRRTSVAFPTLLVSACVGPVLSARLLLGAYYASSALVLLTGVYFVVMKPLSIVHGSQYRRLDVMSGIVLVCAAMAIYLLSRSL